MAHDNKTPASILTAPLRVVRHVVSHTIQYDVIKDAYGEERKQQIGIKPETFSTEYEVNPLTGVATNPKKRARKAARARRQAAERRIRKNGRKQDRDL